MPEISFLADRIAAILLDVEGTTTPVDFVHKTLFSYARLHMRDFLEQHWNDCGVRADVEGFHRQFLLDRAKTLGPPLWQADSDAALRASVLRYAHWLMDQDSKHTPLKSLQGKLWQEGYAGGELKSEVYPDVAPAFGRWAGQNKMIGIFSSGSVQAQQLLFANTTSGDLTPFIHEYFDTTTGPKRLAESYRKIAAGLGLEPAEILFVSDTVEELDAAHHAGMDTALSLRDGNISSPTTSHKWIRTFDELVF